MTDQPEYRAKDSVNISVGRGAKDQPEPSRQKLELPGVLPILPLKDVGLFPRMVLPMLLDQARHQALVDHVVGGDKLVGLVAYREGIEPNEIKKLDDLHEIGVAALVLQMAQADKDGLHLVAQGLSRFRVVDLVQREPFIMARVLPAPDQLLDDTETRALLSNLRSLFDRVLDLSPHLPEELKSLASGVSDPGSLCDMVASALSVSAGERQSIVEALEIKERLRRTIALVNHETNVLELGSEIQDQVKKSLDKSQREYYLRQQLKTIKRELGEDEVGGSSEAEELGRRLAEKDLPDPVRTEAERELKRLGAMHPSSSDYHVITTYLDWILNLPYNEFTEDQLEIGQARKVLEADHYDLDKVKRRILEYLSVRKLNPGMKGPILCFVGPPGVGKTSLGRSIARAMGRKFVRISLGGVRDEAEIRGHRRTYVGAMPGRIIQSFRRAGSQNPVFMLDEIDKVGADFRGDPSSALLEVLDPEQNFSFSDHYLDVPFDLSKVMFITTANVLDTIPPPLRDRMEVLEIAGYTVQDKLKIAARYLIPRQRKEHGLKASQFKLSQAAVRLVIEGYTREAGLRNLEREIGSLCRFAARQIAEGEAMSVSIGPEQVREILGLERIIPDSALRTSIPGVATGMAWTPTGGDILFIEASGMAGKGGLTLTGQLGDVMKESARAAVSYVRANADSLGVDPDYFSSHDIHLHVPAGAIPKDGPSAGVTMLTALVSLLTGRPVRPDLSMTGEITLRGMVLPVGGIKEKVLAAKRAGIKTVILPARNQRDLAEVPDNTQKGLKFIFAERMDQVIAHAISRKKARPKKRRSKKAGKRS